MAVTIFREWSASLAATVMSRVIVRAVVSTISMPLMSPPALPMAVVNWPRRPGSFRYRTRTVKLLPGLGRIAMVVPLRSHFNPVQLQRRAGDLSLKGQGDGLVADPIVPHHRCRFTCFVAFDERRHLRLA